MTNTWPFLILIIEYAIKQEKIYERRCMKIVQLALLTVIIVKNSQT